MTVLQVLPASGKKQAGESYAHDVHGFFKNRYSGTSDGPRSLDGSQIG